jgi:hypothetical protein
MLTWSMNTIARLPRNHARVEAAVAKVLKKGGLAVLVGNDSWRGFLTAAHCVEIAFSGRMALGDCYFEDLEEVEIAGYKFRTSIHFAEPRSDIAFLGPVDDQALPRDAEIFEKVCWDREPVPICFKELTLRKEFPAYVYTHKGRWMRGKVSQWQRMAKGLCFKTKKEIEGGTSGGPIVNSLGQLIGIVSNASVKSPALPKSSGFHPRPHMTIPVWAWAKVVGSPPKI